MSRPSLLLLAVLTLAACEVSSTSNRCVFVELEHLARQFDISGKTLICNPKRVSAVYRDQYFPGYVWGDETW